MKAGRLLPHQFGWASCEGAARITLDRPEKKNPLTLESYAELGAAFRYLREAKAVKAVVLTGAGCNCSSGDDVHEIIGPQGRAGAVRHRSGSRRHRCGVLW